MRLRSVLELLPAVMDAQLRRDADVTEFDYYVLAILSEAPDNTLRMTMLARQTVSTLPRLSHVVSRLEVRGLVTRAPCADDGRAIEVRLSESGWRTVRAAAPGHAATVRHHVLDVLSREQVDQLAAIGDALLTRLDPTGSMAATYARYDEPTPPVVP